MKTSRKPVLPGYLQSKAALYLKIGPDRYRKADALRVPPEDLPKDLSRRFRSGVQQLLDGRGLAAETPLQGLGISGLNQLMAMFHFEAVEQSATRLPDGSMLDTILFAHRVTPELEVTLFNKVEEEY